MIGLGGQLGLNALGAFELATLQSSATFVPHRGRAHSRLTSRNVRSALRSTRARSTITATKASSEVTNG